MKKELFALATLLCMSANMNAQNKKYFLMIP